MTAPDATASTGTGHHWTWPRTRWIVLGVLVGLTLLWLTPAIASWVGGLDLSTLPNLYPVIFVCVVFDAVIPIFPSESLLNAASALAAQDGSTIELWKVTLAGVLGAIVGDSLLYWLSRTVLRPVMNTRVEQAMANPKISQAMVVMNRNAPMLIVFGRFVPGLRFMVGATMGLTRFNYPRFLLWDVIGGTFWGVYTCVFAYTIASLMNGDPLLSAIVSGVITTGFLALIYTRLQKSRQASDRADAAAVAT